MGTGADDLGSIEARVREVERLRSSGVEQRLAEARELERLTADRGGPLHHRARLVVGDMLFRTGDTAEAGRLAVEVNGWAEANRERALLARSHLVLSSIFENIGDVASALDHAVRGIALLDDDTPVRDRALHLLRLADATAASGSPDLARDRYQEAERGFVAAGDRVMQLYLLNNLVVTESEAGDVSAALVSADRLRRLAGAHDNADFADTVARVYLDAGRHDEALQVLAEGRRLLAEQGDSQPATPAELALTHAEVLLAREDLDGAGERLQEALTVCERRGLEGLRVRALAVRAELLAAAGDFEAAYHAHRTFYAETERLRSRQQDAAARTRQALFETAEARREAQRFKEQARTDPLTGLWNRRHVDEQLPALLAADSGVVTATVVDLDHFKRINDGFSHDVGDEVLRVLAGFLRAACGPAPAFAARLGGEEFLLVRVDAGAVEAMAAVERLRAEVERYSWAVLAEGLAVTLSAGTAVAGPDDTQRSLLRRADRHLYDAKSAGRNRVVADPAVPLPPLPIA